ncbi:hypothetical protein J4526_01155 [Desulfurococcaceae archaeon MEX13E-LK6-19]|nr:hypothetical protein J4526_01155 [Desulfurococcaceae archaeon MEX13E-LK6-19]
MGEKVVFEGVVVGFEKDDANKYLVSLQGSVGSEYKSFYLAVDEKTFNELMKLGVGRMIRGEGEILADNPTIVKLLSLNET